MVAKNNSDYAKSSSLSKPSPFMAMVLADHCDLWKYVSLLFRRQRPELPWPSGWWASCASRQLKKRFLFHTLHYPCIKPFWEHSGNMWHRLTSTVIAQGEAVSSGLTETSLSSPMLPSGSFLAANSSARLPSACSSAPSTRAIPLHLPLASPTSSLSFYFPVSNFVTCFPFQPPSQVQTLFNSTNIAFPYNVDIRVSETLTQVVWVLAEELTFSSHLPYNDCPPGSTASSPEQNRLAWAKGRRQH